MGRKSSYLQLSESKDREAYNLLLNCYHVEMRHLKECGLSQNRVNSYLKEKLLEKIQTQDKTVYKLSDKGYKTLERTLGAEHCRYHSQGLEHNLRLADRYCEIVRDNPQVIWKNEEDLKRERREIVSELRERGQFILAEKLSLSSVPDAVVSGEVNYAIDIVTDNYSSTTIELKEEYCECMSLECKFEKI